MGKLLIRLPELCGNPTSNYQVAKQEMAKKIMNLAFKIYFLMFRSGVVRAIKSYDMGPTSLLPF
jgi:hypothetical protein